MLLWLESIHGLNQLLTTIQQLFQLSIKRESWILTCCPLQSSDRLPHINGWGVGGCTSMRVGPRSGKHKTLGTAGWGEVVGAFSSYGSVR